MEKLTSVDIKGEDGLPESQESFTNKGALQHVRRWRRRRRSSSRRKRGKDEEANKGQEADQPEEDRRILTENDGVRQIV